jgi:hypothetical protein
MAARLRERQPPEIVGRDLLRNLAKAVPVGFAGSIAGRECPQQTGIIDPARCDRVALRCSS